jgi:transcriptional regulator with XRE-family HTH domain
LLFGCVLFKKYKNKKFLALLQDKMHFCKNNAMNFAERLKALRKRKGLTQGELAELIDVHYAQVSRYERSETMPNAQVVVNIAKALESTVDYLVAGPPPVSSDAETVVIQLNHPKAMQLLNDLEELDLIRIVK